MTRSAFGATAPSDPRPQAGGPADDPSPGQGTDDGRRGGTTAPGAVGTGVRRARGDVAPGDPASDDRASDDRSFNDRSFSDRSLALIALVLALPMTWLGYGTDIDVPAVLSVGEMIRDGDYTPSRNPGVPVFEVIAALLDPLGGHVAINVATAVALAVTVVGIARLVRAAGHRNGDLVALAFLASPVTLVAGSSTGDFVWALAFLVWGTLALWHDRSVLAGIAFALAVGSRSSTLLLIVAVLVADAWDRRHRRRSVIAGAVMVPLGAALFVPAWLAFNRTFEFMAHSEAYIGFANNLGRFAYKNYAVAGVALIVVVAALLPALVRSLGRWGDDVLLRSAVLVLVVSEGLFFLVPWKAAHLLPSLVALVLWVAVAGPSRRVLWILIGAVALNGLVAFRPLEPDRPDASTSAELNPALTFGLLVNDIDCRVQYMDQKPERDSGVWACSLRPMRGAAGDDTDLEG